MRSENAYLFDMLDSVKLVMSFVQGMTIERFLTDTLTQDAVVRRLMIIGEAAKKIDQSTRQSLPQIPFDDIARMRDTITHAYWRTNLQVVGETATKDLLVLIDALSAQIPPLEPPHGEVT
jgi:uncharacterized protein with HEPN domain